MSEGLGFVLFCFILEKKKEEGQGSLPKSFAFWAIIIGLMGIPRDGSEASRAFWQEEKKLNTSDSKSR